MHLVGLLELAALEHEVVIDRLPDQVLDVLDDPAILLLVLPVLVCHLRLFHLSNRE